MSPRKNVWSKRITALICEKSKPITVLIASLFLSLALIAGSLLANIAVELKSQIYGSEIISSVLEDFLPKTNGVPALEPQRAVTFFSYINAMATAVVNLEILPEEQLRGFNTIYDAAAHLNITLSGFAFNEETKTISTECSSIQMGNVEIFTELVRDSMVFSDVSLSKEYRVAKEHVEFFVIICSF